jgi:hypothetical protein
MSQPLPEQVGRLPRPLSDDALVEHHPDEKRKRIGQDQPIRRLVQG